MPSAAVHDTRPYGREHLLPAAAGMEIQCRFWDFRLTAETAPPAKGVQAVCAFVSAALDRPCLETLAGVGVKLIGLRT